MTVTKNQPLEQMVGFNNQQDVVVLNKILAEINRNAARLPDVGQLAVIKYFNTIPTSADIPQGTLGIYDIGPGTAKRFYFKTNLNVLVYIEVGYYDSELGTWIGPG